MNPIVKEFIDNGYVSYELIPGVIMVENFITQEFIDEMFIIINSQTEDDWYKEYYRNFINFCQKKFGRDDVDNLIAEGLVEITPNWIDKILPVTTIKSVGEVGQKLKNILSPLQELKFKSFGVIQRQYEGVPLIAHVDIHTDTNIKYAAILYLNDDYVDGEIFWSNKNYQTKPPKGSLLIFPGNEEFKHGVNAPGKGPLRYVMPAFIY